MLPNTAQPRGQYCPTRPNTAQHCPTLPCRLQNPLAYGIPWEEVASDPALEGHRRKLITEAARELERSKMARFDERSGNLYVTGKRALVLFGGAGTAGRWVGCPALPCPQRCACAWRTRVHLPPVPKAKTESSRSVTAALSYM